MSEEKRYIFTEIKVNEKDNKRCSIKCQHIKKRQGLYNCVLFERVVDGAIDDDEIGYGFLRTKHCLDSEIKKEALNE